MLLLTVSPSTGVGRKADGGEVRRGRFEFRPFPFNYVAFSLTCHCSATTYECGWSCDNFHSPRWLWLIARRTHSTSSRGRRSFPPSLSKRSACSIARIRVRGSVPSLRMGCRGVDRCLGRTVDRSRDQLLRVRSRDVQDGVEFIWYALWTRRLRGRSRPFSYARATG